jgi:hypothetical protein
MNIGEILIREASQIGLFSSEKDTATERAREKNACSSGSFDGTTDWTASLAFADNRIEA